MQSWEVTRYLTAAAALAAGLTIGIIDLGATEVVVPLALILGASLVLAVLSPRDAWLSGPLVALGLPLLHVCAALLGRGERDTAWHYGLMALVAMVPALLGAGSGAGIRWLLRAA